jgi:Holliday junction resolvase RusA-like endonuclease
MNYFAFRTEFVLKCNILGWSLTPKIDLTFIIPMPTSWGKMKRETMNGKPHQQKPDCDNLVKSICDAFGKDDGFVYSIKAEKYWGKEGKIIINT